MKPLSKILLRVAAILPIVAFIAWQVYHACFAETITSSTHTINIDLETQSILDEEMQKTIDVTSPQWASAVVMAVPSGVVMATYSSDSIEHFRDTLDFGSLTMPLQLLEAIRCGKLNQYAFAQIHKEGIVVDSLRYCDGQPRDTTFDIADIIAASSQVGAATLLSQSDLDIHGYLFKGHSTMIDVADQYCYIADDLNRPRHDSNMLMIQKGLHDVVWNNNIGTASVRQWGGNIIAYKAQNDSIHIAGKTGSAQVFRDGILTNEYRISFVGYFPEEAPRYCCLVVIDSPSNYPFYDAGYDCGGTVRRIAERIYK